VLRALERAVLAEFAPAERARVGLAARAEVRAEGQAHELTVAARPWASLAGRFHAAHERRHGFADRAARVRVVTLEVTGHLAAGLPPERESRARPRPAAADRVRVWYGGRAIEARRVARESLPAGRALRGPAVVTDDGATLWLAPGWHARMGRDGGLLLERERRA
jgi:N-methylhydantoinase A/oxoprolinase/acetone carboxylase beta subunit